VPNICFFLPFCIIFANISTPFEIKIGATDISAFFKTTKAPKKWQNDAKGRKEANVWHWAKFSSGAIFSPELNLSRCYI